MLIPCICSTAGLLALADDATSEIRTVTGEMRVASLVSINDEFSEFAGPTTGGPVNEFKLRHAQLVRWGQPARLSKRPFLVLADMSVLALKNRSELVSIDDGVVRIASVFFEPTSIPLDSIRAIVLSPPSEPELRERFVVHARGRQSAFDELALSNGDLLRGRFVRMSEEAIVFDIAGRERSIRRDRVSMLAYSTKYLRQIESDQRTAVFGLKDGSRIVASDLRLSADSFQCKLLGEFKLEAFAGKLPELRQNLCFFQPSSDQVVYLSDLTPTGYRFVPFLSGRWDYRRDADLLERMLSSGDHRSLKGLAMFSTSRLTFSLPVGSKRFQSELGLARDESFGGSVRYRVFQKRDDEWIESFNSPIIRNDSSLHLCDVELAADAEAISLVVDFADRGDQADHALWLDARLIVHPPHRLTAPDDVQ